MRNLVFWLVWALILSGWLAWAQSSKIQVPLSIQENCLLSPQGLIDECPEYREDMREVNYELENSWKESQALGLQDLSEHITKDIARFKNPYDTSWQITTTELFLNDYRLYISQKFQEFIKKNPTQAQPVQAFFATTYFDQDQSWLSIVDLQFYNQTPTQYDQSIHLLLSLRNFSTQDIHTIQGIYCFSTSSGRDYMYVLDVQPKVDAQSINNLVVSLDLWISPLLDKLEKKWLACVVVYTQDSMPHYTNRSTLLFDLKN